MSFYTFDARPEAATPASASGSGQLHALLNLQQWNGAWTLNEELARLSNVSVAQVNAAVPAITDDTVLGTLLATTVVKEKFATQLGVWQSIINKATAFLDKQPNQAAIQAAIVALRALIKS